MKAHRLLRVVVLSVAVALAACTGGSGSSGFDLVENIVINQALDELRCVEHAGLTICPTDSPSSPDLPAPLDMRVDTVLGENTTVECPALNGDGLCGVTFLLAPQGFPPNAEFRIAVRTQPPDDPWEVLPEPTPVGSTDPAVFDLVIPVDISSIDPAGDLTIQVAVLVFFEGTDLMAGGIAQLADTGADLVFVTSELTVLSE